MTASVEKTLVFQRENQRISASDVLQALAGGHEIDLQNCTISGELDVNRLFEPAEGFDLSNALTTSSGDSTTVTFAQPISMNACIFEGNVVFGPPWEQQEKLQVCFEANVKFNSSTFQEQCRFTNARFKDLAGFDGCIFKRVCCFRRGHFHKRCLFRTTTFEGYGLYNEAVFHDDMLFTNTGFGRGANFTNVRFESRTDFAGVHSTSKAVPIYEGVVFTRKYYGDDESFWRFIKQSMQEAGYYKQAGESFYQERCANFWFRFRGANYDKLTRGQKALQLLKGVRLMPELILGRLLFGYGERPVRVIISAMVVILLCGLFYSSDMASLISRADGTAADLTLFEGVYFSTITFATLGLGDIYPAHSDSITRLVTMAEALSGACLMSLFVVCLAKRYSRG